MKNKLAFTLAEVLITLAIIGVVAALSIPSVISNSQQQEFKTGLRKAVSVLNSAITMNMALDGESPYENKDLFKYLQRHMSVIKNYVELPWRAAYIGWNGHTYDGYRNTAFYTTDGMRFEFDGARSKPENLHSTLALHENRNIKACFATSDILEGGFIGGGGEYREYENCGGCGSYGLNHNPNGTTKPPCAILVDVNGDRKPTPQKAANSYDECQKDPECSKIQRYWVPTLESKRVSDIFVILITEDRAIPYGVVAQKAMYQAQK